MANPWSRQEGSVRSGGEALAAGDDPEVAGSFAAIRHAGAEASRERSAHIAGLVLDGLRPRA